MAGGGSAAGAAPGLVTCAKTARVSETAGQSFDVSALWSPRFPTADLVAAAAGHFTKRPDSASARGLSGRNSWDDLIAFDSATITTEGFRPRIVIGPGVIALERSDPAKAERAAERDGRRRQVNAEIEAVWLNATGELVQDPDPTREVKDWSRRSRARMTRRLAELDWTPLISGNSVPAMVTLTYPGDWLTVAPDGKTVKKQLRAFLWRFERAWGIKLIGVWKLEFQGRGAPHFHIFMVPPIGLAGADRALKAKRYRAAVGDGLPFPQWLSVVWVDIVAHPDPEQKRRHSLAGTGIDYGKGMEARDPKRLAVYFTKHGQYKAKDYQHDVPEEWQEPGKGPGRFWGYWGLEVTTASVELTVEDYYRLSRTLRRLASRTRYWDEKTGKHYWRKAVREARVPRKKVNRETGEITWEAFRKVTRPVTRFKHTSGFLCVNDGPSMAVTLARIL